MRDLEVDISDDVSALSMDGASAIAGMGFAKRLRKDFAKMQLGVPIQEEEDGAENDEHDHHTSSRRSQLSSKYDRKSSPGEELIEPFPKTYEEWQRKKEKKQRKKEKKSHKHKSKKSGSKSGSRASGRHKDKEREEMNNIGEKSGPPPIMEISIQSENYEAEKEPPRITSPDRRRSSQQDSSNLSGYPSIASTADDSESQFGTRRGSMTSGMISRKQSQSSHLNNSFKSSRSSYNDSHTRSSQYDDENESRTHMTAHSTASQSHITTDDLNQLRANLERVKIEEKQVLDIFKRLQTEVQAAEIKYEKTKQHYQSITSELELASMEREKLHKQLDKLQHGNNKLTMKLRNLEEKESDKGLDDVLDSMEAKIKALKFKSNRRSSMKSSKEKDSTTMKRPPR